MAEKILVTEPLSPEDVEQSLKGTSESIKRRTMELPDGKKIYINYENNKEVTFSVTSPGKSPEYQTLSRSDFDALVNEFEASLNQGPSATKAAGEVDISEPKPAEEPSSEGKGSENLNSAVPAPAENNGVLRVAKAEVTSDPGAKVEEGTDLNGQGGVTENSGPDALNTDTEAEQSIDYRSIKPGDRVKSKKPSAAGIAELTVSAVRENMRTGKMEYTISDINTKNGGETAHVWATQDDIIAHEAVLQNEVPGQTPGATEIPVQPVETGSAKAELTPRTLDEARAELAAARNEYGDLEDKQSDKAGELRSKIQELSQEVVNWAENHPDAKASETEVAEGDAVAKKPLTNSEIFLSTQIEALEKAKADKWAELEALDFEDKAGEKGAELRQQIKDLDSQINEAKETFAKQPGKTADKAEEEGVEKKDDTAKKEAAKAEKDIRDSLAEAETRRVAALEKYAKAKADYDTRGMIITFGHSRRKEAMEVAAKELKQVELEYATKLSTKKREAGLFEGEGIQQEQQVSDDIFNQLRAMATDRRNKYVTERLVRMEPENQKWHEKAYLKVGNMLNKGGKVWRALKSGGIGAGIGAVKGAAVALTGVTMPAVLAFGALTTAGSFAVGTAARKASLNQAFKEKVAGINTSGVEGVMNDEQFAKFMQEMRRSGIKSQDSLAGRLVDRMHNETAAVSEKEIKDSRIAGRRAMSAYAVGSVLGGLVSGGATNWLQGRFAEVQGVHQATPATSQANMGDFKKLEYPSIDSLDHEGVPNLNLGADIDISEGGLEQLDELYHNNGIDVSKLTGSDKLQIWDDLTRDTQDLYAGNGTAGDVYMMADGHNGINAPNPGNSWNPDVAQSAIKKAKAILASRG